MILSWKELETLRFETCETCEQTFQNLRGEICRSLSAAPLAFSDSQEPFGSFPQIAPLAPLAFSDSDALMHTFAASYCPSPMAFSREQVLVAYWRLFSQWLIEMYFKPEVDIRERVKLWALCNTWEHDPMDLEESWRNSPMRR